MQVTNCSSFAVDKENLCLKSFTPRGKKGGWSPKEDEALHRWVANFGAQRWTECAKIIQGRCGKQCRERWVNILNPNVKKGDWSNSEQRKIYDCLTRHSTAWSTIALELPGRTENSIKNYFYSSLRRIKAGPLHQLLISKTDFSSEEVQRELKRLNDLGRYLSELAFGVKQSPLRESVMSFLEFESKVDCQDRTKEPEIEETALSSNDGDASRGVQRVSGVPKCWNCLLGECLRHPSL